MNSVLNRHYENRMAVTARRHGCGTGGAAPETDFCITDFQYGVFLFTEYAPVWIEFSVCSTVLCRRRGRNVHPCVGYLIIS